MKTITLSKEFDIALNLMLQVNNEQAHKIEALFEKMPKELQHKITMLCNFKQGRKVRSSETESNKQISEYGFRFQDDTAKYEILASFHVNKATKISIFREELENSDNYITLELNASSKQQLKDLTNQIELGSFTQYKSNNLFYEETYDYTLKKENDYNIVAMIKQAQNEEDEVKVVKYSVSLDHFLNEAEQNR
jgi:hypothetical protein